MNTQNSTMWGFGRASVAERRLGRFMRSEEGHADAAGAAVSGEGASAAADDASAGVGADAQAAAGAEAEKVATTENDAAGDAGDAGAEAGDAGENEGTVIGDAGKEPAADAAAGEADGDGSDAEPKPYEGLTPPEGFEALDADALAAATPLMRKFGVADDQAQDFINEAAPVIKGMIERGLAAAQEAQRQNHAEIERGWVAEMQSHPEFGGQNFEQSKTFVARALDAYFPAEFRQFLNESRLGQHPAMFEGLAKIGKEVAEDTVDIPGAAGQRGRGHPVYDDLFLPPEQRG